MAGVRWKARENCPFCAAMGDVSGIGVGCAEQGAAARRASSRATGARRAAMAAGGGGKGAARREEVNTDLW
jgi:hypothetical protein